jgi:hypothetical protein
MIEVGTAQEAAPPFQVRVGGLSCWGLAPSTRAATGAAWCSAAPPD